MLQWSRDLEIAEMNTAPRCTPVQPRLQWSRDLEIAEIALIITLQLSKIYPSIRERLGRCVEDTPSSWRGETGNCLPLNLVAFVERSPPLLHHLAARYLVTNTGYSPISPSSTRASSRAWISSSRR